MAPVVLYCLISELLTGAEHLLFYGRLESLDPDLEGAVIGNVQPYCIQLAWIVTQGRSKRTWR